VALPYRRQASKAAQLRFYETLRTEVGSEVGITILTPGYVESEITKGKGIQKTGEVAVDEDARDVLQQSSLSLSRSLIFCARAPRSLTAGLLLHFLQAQIGVFPVGRVEALCEVALDGIRNGDWYVTWPSMYRPLQLIACLAPEVLDWMSKTMYKEATTAQGSRQPLGQRILEATGAKRLYPPSLLQPRIKTD
jgi:hypothetical protein